MKLFAAISLSLLSDLSSWSCTPVLPFSRYSALEHAGDNDDQKFSPWDLSSGFLVDCKDASSREVPEWWAYGPPMHATCSAHSRLHLYISWTKSANFLRWQISSEVMWFWRDASRDSIAFWVTTIFPSPALVVDQHSIPYMTLEWNNSVFLSVGRPLSRNTVFILYKRIYVALLRLCIRLRSCRLIQLMS